MPLDPVECLLEPPALMRLDRRAIEKAALFDRIVEVDCFERERRIDRGPTAEPRVPQQMLGRIDRQELAALQERDRAQTLEGFESLVGDLKQRQTSPHATMLEQARMITRVHLDHEGLLGRRPCLSQRRPHERMPQVKPLDPGVVLPRARAHRHPKSLAERLGQRGMGLDLEAPHSPLVDDPIGRLDGVEIAVHQPSQRRIEGCEPQG